MLQHSAHNGAGTVTTVLAEGVSPEPLVDSGMPSDYLLSKEQWHGAACPVQVIRHAQHNHSAAQEQQRHLLAHRHGSANFQHSSYETCQASARFRSDSEHMRPETLSQMAAAAAAI
jgi:hypothetical protein